MDLHHHAVILRAPDPFSCRNIPKVPEIEYLSVEVERFGIDNTRALVTQASQRPEYSEVQCIVVRTYFITHEAQNALLKILEEPPSSTSFLFILPLDLILLPTLLSRFETAESPESVEELEEQNVLDSFLQLSYKDRLTIIETELKKKNANWQRIMKSDLISYLHVHPESRSNVLEYIARALLTRGASNKMLLEQMALILPVS